MYRQIQQRIQNILTDRETELYHGLTRTELKIENPLSILNLLTYVGATALIVVSIWFGEYRIVPSMSTVLIGLFLFRRYLSTVFATTSAS